MTPLNIPQVTPNEGIRTLPSKIAPQMAVRPAIGWCFTDTPTPATPMESSGDSDKSISPDHQPEIGSVESFPGHCPPSDTSNGSQSTTPTILDQGLPDDTKSQVDPDIKVSKPRPQGEDSLVEQLLGFCRSLFHRGSHCAYLSFLRAYPEYKLTRPIDTLREQEYKRLKRSDAVYMDYMGASLYPTSLIRSDAAFLRRAILGNTHSINTRYARKFDNTGK